MLASLAIGPMEMGQGGSYLFDDSAGPTPYTLWQLNGLHSSIIKRFPFPGLLTFWAYFSGLRGFVVFHSLTFVTFLQWNVNAASSAL